ncbi:hypothetical protein EIP86_011214 [Pleurotus ostreatoroseus]|nr:hypothetical protein EIP86_011214 [Pleurotus ostreatoroseus]
MISMHLQHTWKSILIGSLAVYRCWAQASSASAAQLKDIVPRPLSPDAFPQNVADCHAINRVTGEEKSIQIHYVDINPQANKTIIMVHGWPSLWHSWKYQIEAFKDDYHLIVPDLRGFGQSTHPGDVQNSGTMPDMVGDLVCTLKHAGISKALCVGHDWGTQYLPYNGPYAPIDDLLEEMPKLSYNVYFERMTNQAIHELNTDIRRTLRATLRSMASPPPDAFLQQTDSFLQGWDDMPGSDTFQALNFYTYGNQYASREIAHAQGNFTIPQPALSILSSGDPVANWSLAATLMKSEEFVPHLTTKSVDAAHWLQLEKPDEVNAIMKEWLEQWYPPVSDIPATQDTTNTQSEHARDEL